LEATITQAQMMARLCSSSMLRLVHWCLWLFATKSWNWTPILVNSHGLLEITNL